MRDLPRLIKRGLIEATVAFGSSLPPSTPLPRLIKRGLIEAFQWGVYLPFDVFLPRLIKRGLIEAFCKYAPV